MTQDGRSYSMHLDKDGKLHVDPAADNVELTEDGWIRASWDNNREFWYVDDKARQTAGLGRHWFNLRQWVLYWWHRIRYRNEDWYG